MNASLYTRAHTRTQTQNDTRCDFLIHSLAQTPYMLDPTVPIMQHSTLFVPSQQRPLKFKSLLLAAEPLGFIFKMFCKLN